MYNVFIQHLHALCNGHQHKLNNHLLPYKIIMLFIIFIMLYSTSYWLIFSITGSFYFLIPFTLFTQALTSLPSANYQFAFWICSLFLFCFVYSFVLCLRLHIVRSYGIFFVCLISLSIIQCMPCMLWQMVRFHSFYGWVCLHLYLHLHL